MVDLNGKTILVTGGSGFIGSNFIEKCLQEYPDIRHIANVDKLGIGSRDLQIKDDRYKFHNHNLCGEPIHLGYTKQLDYIFHFAAESHVDRSIVDPTAFIKNNVDSTVNLLNYVKDFNSQAKIVCISTDEVYGHLTNENDPPFTENSPLRPRSPYAASKAASDLIALAMAETYGLKLVVTRCCNNFGPHQGDEKLIPTVIRNIIKGTPVPVYGTGQNIREWIPVADHNTAVLNVADYIGYSDEKIWNIGSGIEYTNLELIQHISDILNQHVDIKFVEDRKAHDFRYAIENMVKYQPSDFETELENTVEFYKEKYEAQLQ